MFINLLCFMTGIITAYGMQKCLTKYSPYTDKVKNALLGYALYKVFSKKIDDGSKEYDGSKLPKYSDKELSDAMIRYYFYEKITDEKKKAIENFIDINVYTKQECVVFLNRFFNIKN